MRAAAEAVVVVVIDVEAAASSRRGTGSSPSTAARARQPHAPPDQRRPAACGRAARRGSRPAAASLSRRASRFHQRTGHAPCRAWRACLAFSAAMTLPMSLMAGRPGLGDRLGHGGFGQRGIVHLPAAGSLRSPRSRPVPWRPAPGGCPGDRGRPIRGATSPCRAASAITSSSGDLGDALRPRGDVGVLQSGQDHAQRRGARRVAGLHRGLELASVNWSLSASAPRKNHPSICFRCLAGRRVVIGMLAAERPVAPAGGRRVVLLGPVP